MFCLKDVMLIGHTVRLVVLQCDRSLVGLLVTGNGDNNTIHIMLFAILHGLMPRATYKCK